MNALKKIKQETSFEKLGLQIAHGPVEIGKTYPIYGIITKLISDKPGDIIAEINYNIHAKMAIPDPEKIELLKQRAFETGIFISTIKALEPVIQVDCQTVIFGRPQAYNA